MKQIALLIGIGVLLTAAVAEARGRGGAIRGSRTTNVRSNGGGTGSFSKSHSVKGHINKSGVYIPPHRQTNPNSTQRDNYGAKGNYNPNTGKMGTVPATK
jgi:hypothetical protein